MPPFRTSQKQIRSDSAAKKRRFGADSTKYGYHASISNYADICTGSKCIRLELEFGLRCPAPGAWIVDLGKISFDIMEKISRHSWTVSALRIPLAIAQPERAVSFVCY